MTAIRLDGVATASTIKGELAERITALKPSPDIEALAARTKKLAGGFPLYEGLTSPGSWN